MRRLLIIGGTVLVLALIGQALMRLDASLIWDALRQSRYELWGVGVLLTLAGLYTRAYRWHLLLGGQISVRRCFHINNIAYMLNMMIPLRIGELARIALVTQGEATVTPSYALAGIVLERLIDLIILLLVLGVALLMLPVAEYISLTSAMLAGIVGGLLLILLVLAHAPQRVYRVLSWFEVRLTILQILKLEQRFHQFQQGLQVLTSTHQTLALIGWSLLSWALTFAVGYVLLLAFFGQATLAVVLFFNAFASVAVTTVNAISYVPSAVGPYQASVVLALQVIGITEPAGVPLAFAIVLHLVNFVTVSAMGVMGMISEGLSWLSLWRLRYRSSSTA
ncbi:MAG: lysylphosphatidylglycerol synthase transmembrane domain-containing protein [Anaerolineae bacterium]